MDPFSLLLSTASLLIRQFQTLSSSSADAQATLRRLSASADLLQLISASPGAWEAAPVQLEAMGEALSLAREAAEAALPLAAKDASWFSRAWRGMGRFAKAKTLAAALVSVNDALDRAIQALNAALAASTKADSAALRADTAALLG